MIHVKINKKKIVAILVLGLIAFYGNQTLAVTEISDGSVKALYHLEDTVDSSGNGYTLTNVNTVTFVEAKFNDGSQTSSNTNKKLWYNGGFGFNQAPFTISFWFKPVADITSGNWELTSYAMGSPAYSALNTEYNYNSGTRQFKFIRQRYGAGEDSCTYNHTLGTDWHYITQKWDGSFMRGYIDGVLVCQVSSSANGSSSGSTNVFNLYYGEQTSGGYGDGNLDDVAVLNVDLSTTTILSIYNSGNGNEICVTAGCDDATSTTSTFVIGTSTYDNIDQISGVTYTYDGTGATSSVAYTTYTIPFLLWLIFYLVLIPIVMRLILEIIIRLRQ